MAYQRGIGGIISARVQQRLKPARGSIEKERTNCWFRFAHRIQITSPPLAVVYSFLMDAITLTRQLIDIESISGNEAAVGHYLYGELCRLGYQTRKIPVEGERFNLYATSPDHPYPAIVFSTHMDTVPPFIPSSEDATRIYGRGSCDAKGIIAAQVAAAERLHQQQIHVGLLFVAGEERDSLGAKVANEYAVSQKIQSKFLINGEPTDNRIALASKGTLRVEVTASGRMAHSAYPELGDSAINKIIPALGRLLAMPLPSDPEIGPSTLNIGLIEGGRAPNVISDHAHADLTVRLIGPTEELRRQIVAAAGDQVKIDFPLELPFLRFRSLDGLPTMIAAFTTDIPRLTNWGEPLLIGPGSIHVAHTDREFLEKRELVEAIDLYCKIAQQLSR